MKILVTGGLGFIGSSFIRKVINLNKNIKIYNIDKKSYASYDHNKKFFLYKNYKFFKEDILNFNKIKILIKKIKPNYIVNFASETHVDNSIKDSKLFINNNIFLTYNLLESIRILKLNKKIRFIQISTDEVYGSTKKIKPFSENARYFPNSPYSASKASADHIVRSFDKTYGLKTLILHPSNNFGPYQHEEKFLPVIINCCLKRKQIPIYGKGHQVRDWLFVEDCADAVFKLMIKGDEGNHYNITTRNLIKNIDMVNIICNKIDKILNKPKNFSNKLISYVADRPGHDFRYNISNKKIRKKIKWRYKKNFSTKVDETINWYINKFRKL